MTGLATAAMRTKTADGVRTYRRSHARLRVVVAGGGVAGLEAVLTLAERAGGRLDVTLVANQDDFVFRAPAVGAPSALGRSYRLSLHDVARHTGATFRRAWVTGVDAQSRQLVLAGDQRMGFDALLLALGARSRPAHPAFTTWRDDDADALAGLVRDVEEGLSRSMAFVVPPRPVRPAAAYELALLLRRWVCWTGQDTEITLVTSEEQPLAAFGPTVTAAAARELERVGVRVKTGVDAHPLRGHSKLLRLRPSGETLEVDRVVVLPRLEGRRLDGVPADDDGFIPVDDGYAVRELDGIWAAGDGIAFAIKHGGLAAQQAGVAAAAIAALARAGVEPFRPVLSTHARPYHPPAEDGEASSGALTWPLSHAVGDRLAAYLTNYGAGPWLRSRSASPGGGARELRNRGQRRARQERRG